MKKYLMRCLWILIILSLRLNAQHTLSHTSWGAQRLNYNDDSLQGISLKLVSTYLGDEGSHEAFRDSHYLSPEFLKFPFEFLPSMIKDSFLCRITEDTLKATHTFFLQQDQVAFLAPHLNQTPRSMVLRDYRDFDVYLSASVDPLGISNFFIDQSILPDEPFVKFASRYIEGGFSMGNYFDESQKKDIQYALFGFSDSIGFQVIVPFLKERKAVTPHEGFWEANVPASSYLFRIPKYFQECANGLVAFCNDSSKLEYFQSDIFFPVSSSYSPHNKRLDEIFYLRVNLSALDSNSYEYQVPLIIDIKKFNLYARIWEFSLHNPEKDVFMIRYTMTLNELSLEERKALIDLILPH